MYDTPSASSKMARARRPLPSGVLVARSQPSSVWRAAALTSSVNAGFRPRITASTLSSAGPSLADAGDATISVPHLPGRVLSSHCSPRLPQVTVVDPHLQRGRVCELWHRTRS